MGKTTLLIKLLKFYWLETFNKIFIFCPTYANDSKWSDIDSYVKSGQVVVYPEVTEKILNNIWAECTRIKKIKPKYHTLILMDDCVGQKDFKTNSEQGIINKLVCKGNHDNISTIYSVQKLTHVSTTMRLNCEALMVFYVSDMTEKKSLYREFGVGTLSQFLRILEASTIHAYHYLFLNRQGPGIADYYHNFKLINLEQELLIK